MNKKRKKAKAHNAPPPALDPDKFLHAWHLACAAADGEVRPLHGLAGKGITLIDGKETLSFQVNNRPETRFFDAIGSVFSRNDGIAASASAATRVISLFALIAQRKGSRWISTIDGVPVIHEALVLGAAQAKLVRHEFEFDLVDLEAKALEMYRERFKPEEDRS